ncbi:YfhO family protein [Liquorilactobacillus nagelii]|uniref:YfhO family protein n=1 Tax=Liquorilactobacillus nagelii TaxID=82688 RepID=UPI0021C2FC2C|nr:YfhO family protein [Liquorilactobacillus nagelii]MCP9316043.1 YfhO family protein [Liquorilactobacillus nagelii]
MPIFFKKEKNLKLYIYYSLIFCLAAVFVYGTYFLTGHSLIWRLDGAQQHLPLLQTYRKFLIYRFQHPFSPLQQWTWKMGLGSDLYQIFAYYTISDIFNYLILLFPANKIVAAYQFLIILRLYCAGLAFCFFANHFKLHRPAILGGTLVYIFNAFLLYSNVAQPFFTLPFIIFPLLLLAIEKVLQGGACWPLILMFSWMLFNNFYFAYILGIGSFIFLCLRYCFNYRKKISVGKTLFKLAYSSVISLLVTAVVWLPEVIAVQNSTRGNGPFANGLKLYPLYYYIALPSQLINGGNRDFYFWSALGFASFAFFAIVFIFSHARHYPVIVSSLLLGGIFLLLPAAGASLNGFLSPSNRWTLMLCLPIALSVAITIEQVTRITPKVLKLFSWSLIFYSTWLAGSYYFQNNERLFIPLIFLFLSYFLLVAAVHHKIPIRLTKLIFVGAILLNVVANAVYFEAPYNGGYSNEMLPSGGFQKLVKKRYAGLDQNLTGKGYRVSTISQNYYLGNGVHMYNAVPSKLNSISSYYSLQNKYLGNWAESLGINQYEANIPLGQVDDRSILNNFLGVKYLFVKKNQTNSQKVPAGYQLDRVSNQIPDANQSNQLSNQTERYTTKNAFPLIYWQNKVFSAKVYQQLSATQKEQALVKGVQTTKSYGLRSARVTPKKQQTIKYQLISSRGNLLDSHKITKFDSAETYRLILDPTQSLKNVELHVEISDLKYQQLKLSQQLKLEEIHQQTAADEGLLSNNNQLEYYRYLRYHILQGTPDNSFKLTVSSSLSDESLFQPQQDQLSFYKTVTGGVLNLGYFENNLPKTLSLNLSKLGYYHFKLKIVAVEINHSYSKQVQQLQKQRLQDLKFKTNQVTGKITTSKNGILTSSIPYSTGWTAKVDGKPVKVLKTNQAFVGLYLRAGNHHVILDYHTPGLKFAARLSGISFVLLLTISLFKFIWKKRFFQNNN